MALTDMSLTGTTHGGTLASGDLATGQSVGGGNKMTPTIGTFVFRPPSPRVKFAPLPREVLVQCPNCKTMETLQFVGSTLLRCRKFHQRDGRIYHDCGSDKPCRLHV